MIEVPIRIGTKRIHLVFEKASPLGWGASIAKWRISSRVNIFRPNDRHRGVAGDDHVIRDIVGHDGTGSDHRTPSDRRAGHHKGAGADEGVFADLDVGDLQGKMGIAQFVGAGAKIGFLRDDRARSDFDRGEGIEVRPVADTGPVVEDQVPRNLDAGTLVDEGNSSNLGAKPLQPKKPPAIERLWCPDAEQRPADLPSEHRDPLRERPWGIVRRLLWARVHVEVFLSWPHRD